jgi:Zn-finger nucleic acid-binding protein
MFRGQGRACPACGQPLVQTERKRWKCEECGGVLVPVRGLADQLTELAPSLLGPDRMVDVGTRARRFDPAVDPASRRCCPQCGHPMDRVALADIPIERCNEDECLWFDGTELDALLARAAAQDASQRGLFRRFLNAIRW